MRLPLFSYVTNAVIIIITIFVYSLSIPGSHWYHRNYEWVLSWDSNCKSTWISSLLHLHILRLYWQEVLIDTFLHIHGSFSSQSHSSSSSKPHVVAKRYAYRRTRWMQPCSLVYAILICAHARATLVLDASWSYRQLHLHQIYHSTHFEPLRQQKFVLICRIPSFGICQPCIWYSHKSSYLSLCPASPS